MAKLFSRKGLTALSALMAACALFVASDAAKASVIPVFSVNPGTINAGQQSTLDLTLTISQDLSLCPNSDCGIVGGDFLGFTGGSVTLNSGSGLSQFFTLNPALAVVNNASSGSFNAITYSEDFQYSFTYPISGQYTPSYSFSVDYQQNLETVVTVFVDTPMKINVPFETTAEGEGEGSLLVDAVNTNPGTGNNPAATPLPSTLSLVILACTRFG